MLIFLSFLVVALVAALIIHARGAQRLLIEQQIRHLEMMKDMQANIQAMTESYVRSTGGTYIPPVRVPTGPGVPTEKWGATKPTPLNPANIKGSIIR